MLKTFSCALFAFATFSLGLHAADCTVLIKKINVTENGYKKIDEVREHQYTAATEESCFEKAQRRLSFYPLDRSYYGSITRSEHTQSFLYRGQIDVYYFAEYEFESQATKTNSKTAQGRIQRDSNQLGVNPVIGRYGEILLKDL